MLYERWQQISQKYADELALWDFSSGQRWTFAELAREAENRRVVGPVVFPGGNDVEFVLDVLAGWRDGKLVCPLEAGQGKPSFEGLELPSDHAKITSGSSGAPRMILFNGNQLEADARQIISTMGLTRACPNFGVISLAHSYGFSNLVTPLLLFGFPLILAAAPFPEIVSAVCKSAGAVTVPAVPALWKVWHEAGVIGLQIKKAISAGAPLPLALEQDIFERTGVKIHNFYGASECGGIAYDQSDVPRTEPGLIGTAMDGVELLRTEGGLLTIKSQAAGLGYWPDSSENFKNGVFQSADLAEIRNGEVFLTGRATDLINVAGRKVAPETIEAALRAHPNVEHAVVFGVPSGSEERGEEIVACVRSNNGKLDAQGLKSFLSKSIPSWQIPRAWWFSHSLQPNIRGKISRAEWKQAYLNHKANPT